MGKLTTHVLDTASGRPAAGMRYRLVHALTQAVLSEGLTNADGRCAQPLLEAERLLPAQYVLQFEVAAYFRDQGVTLPDPPFLDVVSIAFGVADPQSHYHVPLLVSPWAYSSYRGS
jgi:5-hydroxyisourate hydrolase